MYKIKELLGARIKFLRNQSMITQESFAEKIGISPRSLSFIENGKNYPSSETISAICEVLEIEPYKLFLFANKKNIKEIKKLLVDKINTDDEFTLFLYDYAKQIIY